ncbi:MAG: bifunctional adenosylcobinamide kinase/adenosylcobinamide-phosphate guanylyltransferase [Microcystaceae cyanobacterium]
MNQFLKGQIILVTGPARSGKSEWAEQLTRQLACHHQQPMVYVATGLENLDDPEWQSRIALHRQRRSTDWQTINETIALVPRLQSFSEPVCVLVDSLGTWVANLLELTEPQWQEEVKNLSQTLQNSSSQIILVAEETGWGVVPAYPMGRLFRDRLGNLSRSVGAIAHQVYLVTGGYALNLSQLGHRLDSQQNPGIL